MANYEVIFEHAQRANGWGYQFYKEGASAKDVMEDLLGEPGQEEEAGIVQRFRSLHSSATFLNAVSVRNMNRNRTDVRRRQLDLPGLGDTNEYVENKNDDDPDIVGASIQIRLYAANGVQRLLTISGVPDNFIANRPSGGSNLQTGVRAVIEALAGQLESDQLQIKSRAAPVNGTATERIPIRTIEAVPDSDNAFSRFTYKRAAGQLISGDYDVDFYGANSGDILLAPYKGTHKVIDSGAVDGAEDQYYFDIMSQYVGAGAKIIPVLYFVGQVVPAYSLLTDEYDFVKFGTRQRGQARTTRGRSTGVSFRKKSF